MTPIARAPEPGPAAWVATIAATAQNAPVARAVTKRDQDDREIGGDCDKHMACDEDDEGEHECETFRQAQRHDRHQRGADDHAEREHRDQVPGTSKRHMQRLSDLGQDAGDHEFRRQHQECAARQQVDGQRKPLARVDIVAGSCGHLEGHGVLSVRS
ncbi:hypothetical protein [Planctomonas sp. JC2975]|uniref:hypothetical protein n=1 Tax=Planctomonas sp. JC2975 TaxID=2729626 RepID=UPI00197C9C6C|nr:hypothetical protein [Planctomonas sp. JC2975]